MTDIAAQIIAVLPLGWEIRNSDMQGLEEIRLRKGSNARFCYGVTHREFPYMVDHDLLQAVIDRCTEWSAYGAMEMLRKGYLILPGGHRLGLCGTGVYKDGVLRSLRDISSINIRIARHIYNFGRPIADVLWKEPGSALCLGPPCSGKTTLLRDLIRQLSTVYRERISVIDERMELAAVIDGVPQFDLGPTCDVMSCVRKSDAIDMVIRTMAPKWIVLDEITAEEDVTAMIRGAYCGVKFIATAHGNGLKDLRSRPIYKKLLESQIFDHLFTIQQNRTIQKEVLWTYSAS